MLLGLLHVTPHPLESANGERGRRPDREIVLVPYNRGASTVECRLGRRRWVGGGAGLFPGLQGLGSVWR